MTSTPAAPRSTEGHQRQRKPFLNVKEAAEQLRLDESTLYRHLREGRFPGVKVGGRYLVPAAVIEELAAGAMAAGHCVDVDEWAARWREERAAAVLVTDRRYSGEVRR